MRWTGVKRRKMRLIDRRVGFPSWLLIPWLHVLIQTSLKAAHVRVGVLEATGIQTFRLCSPRS
jgi:hypothetical protein